MATEEPSYAVLEQIEEDIELRLYAPMIVAETEVATDEFGRAGNEGFRRLAGYIFGDNQPRQDIAMTAPVMQAPASDGVDIAMTAPVAQQAIEPGRWRVSFVMPAQYTLQSLPAPVDARVALRAVPERRVLAVRFGGNWSERRAAAQLERLQAVLTSRGWSARSAPVSARYNAPWTLPFLKRNEWLIEVE